MEINKTNGVHHQNGTAKEVISKASQKGVAKMDQVNSTADASKPVISNGKETKPETPQSLQTPVEKLKTDVEQAKPAIEAVKAVQNLEITLKVVNDLHRKSIQRINLKSRIMQLEAFEVALTQEHDELEENPYQGCKLIIEDDKRRQFVTTTPGLIRLVSNFIDGACHEKLKEIEESIIFPNA